MCSRKVKSLLQQRSAKWPGAAVDAARTWPPCVCVDLSAAAPCSCLWKVAAQAGSRTVFGLLNGNDHQLIDHMVMTALTSPWVSAAAAAGGCADWKRRQPSVIDFGGAGDGETDLQTDHDDDRRAQRQRQMFTSTSITLAFLMRPNRCASTKPTTSAAVDDGVHFELTKIDVCYQRVVVASMSNRPAQGAGHVAVKAAETRGGRV